MVIRISGYQYMALKGIRLSGYQEVGIRLSEYQATRKSSLMP
jgi:hypothetical protein